MRRSRLRLHCGKYDGCGDREGGILLTLSAERLSWQRTITPDKISGCRPFLAFELQFQEFDCGAGATPYQKMIVFCCQVRGGQLPVERGCTVYLHTLAAKLRVCARPGLKSPQAVQNFRCRAGKIDEAVFLLEDRRERGLGVVLRAGLNASGLQ